MSSDNASNLQFPNLTIKFPSKVWKIIDGYLYRDEEKGSKQDAPKGFLTKP